MATSDALSSHSKNMAIYDTCARWVDNDGTRHPTRCDLFDRYEGSMVSIFIDVKKFYYEIFINWEKMLFFEISRTEKLAKRLISLQRKKAKWTIITVPLIETDGTFYMLQACIQGKFLWNLETSVKSCRITLHFPLLQLSSKNKLSLYVPLHNWHDHFVFTLCAAEIHAER